MTFTLGMTLTADAKGAKAELAATAGEAKKVTAATTEMGTATKTAGAGAQVLAAGAQAATTATERLGNAEAAAAGKAVQMGRTHQLAAGQVGNLTAQFNDIGMMLMAGQNPLQLAIQQGTQITQVIGPMGAMGAVRALGGALMGMLNPISLITIGTIAAGAAMVNWLTGADEDTVTFTDSIKTLGSAVDAYAKASERARASSEDLRAEFGSDSESVRALLKDMAELARLEAERAARGTSQALQSELDISAFQYEIGDQVNLAEVFDLNIWAQEAQSQVNSVLDAFYRLDTAPTLEAQIVAAEALRDRFREAADASGSISEAEGATLGKLGEMVLAMQRLKQEQTETASAPARAASELMASLREQNALQSAALIYGRESAQVAALRADAERRTFEEQLAGLEVSNATKDALRAAFAEGQNLGGAAAAVSDFLGGAAARAGALSGSLGGAAAKAWDMAAGVAAAMASQAKISQEWKSWNATPGALRGADDERGSQREGRKDVADLRTEEMLRSNPAFNPSLGRGSRGGSGASAINAERDAMAELIAKEQLELDILRESDPVQKELLRHRDAMKNATAAERTKLEELIAARMAEKDAATGAQSAWSMLADGATNALDAILFKSKSAGDAVRELARTILQAAGQAFLSGSGPLAGLFGISGGLFGGGGKSIPLFAGGGQLVGPGTGTSDSILMYGSTGEFMVNAKSTAKHLPLLEAINAGAPLPRFARGGRIGGSGAGSSGDHGEGAGPVEFHIHVNGARGNSEISEMIEQGVGQALTTYDREVVPARFAQISRDPGKVG